MIFILIGFVIGALGSLVGLGGGFLLVPLLLVFYPSLNSSLVTSISLFCVTANALSGSLQYAWRKKIHWTLVFILACATLPGAWWGAALTSGIERDYFSLVFGLFLIAMGLYIFFSSKQDEVSKSPNPISFLQYLVGGVVSVLIGVLASFLGIGGGVLHVPFLNKYYKLPLKMATGTSQAILFFSSLTATIYHFQSGHLNVLTEGSSDLQSHFILWLTGGMVLGAQYGAYLSAKLPSKSIAKILATLVILSGIKLCFF